MFFNKGMLKFKTYTLTILLSVISFPQISRAVIIAPSLDKQVQEVAQWFTGSFNNTQQVIQQPSVPFISMSNCEVQLLGDNNDTQNIYLEQKSTAFERIRFYSFSKADSGVKLSIRSFINPNILSGICNNPEPARVLNINNLVSTSCDLLLMWEPNRYVANNAPGGCSTASGGKVVSNVTVKSGSIDSLDQIFAANGNLLVSTPIQFNRIRSIPEASFTIGLLVLSIWAVGKASSQSCKE